MLRVRNPQDLAGGLFLIFVATLALIFSGNLPVGRLVSMGPGYVPRTLAWLVAGLGAIVALRGFTTNPDPNAPSMTEWAWRPMLALTAAILSFAFLLERVGLVICIFITVGVAGLAVKDIGPVQSLTLGALLALVSSFLFVVGLGLPLRLWPEFGG